VYLYDISLVISSIISRYGCITSCLLHYPCYTVLISVFITCYLVVVGEIWLFQYALAHDACICVCVYYGLCGIYAERIHAEYSSEMYFA
jgi:hypothetical protein